MNLDAAGECVRTGNDDDNKTDQACAVSQALINVTGTINVIGMVMSEIDCLIAGNLQ